MSVRNGRRGLEGRWATSTAQSLRRILQRLRPLVASELSALFALALCAGGLWAFMELAEHILEDKRHAFDETLLLWLRQADPADPVGPAWVERAMRDVTALGGYTVILIMSAAAVGYLAIVRQWSSVALIVVSLAGGAALNNALKYWFDRPRPDLVAHLVDVHTLSFPSGHAMLSAITYLTLGALIARVQPNRRLKAYVLAVGVVLTLLVGASRVYLGVHWPTDVLAGWSLGAAWAIACWQAARWWQSIGR
ncbi:phosphatase PAP2 family protein [Reyranella sp. CPCC 100927]|nr:phosphatase PAP2 family protein [Reyranella sp. CPCC 100927]